MTLFYKVSNVLNIDKTFDSLFSSQVLFLICKKLINQQIINGTEVLKWLREILIYRNKFLLKNKVSSFLRCGHSPQRQK